MVKVVKYWDDDDDYYYCCYHHYIIIFLVNWASNNHLTLRLLVSGMAISAESARSLGTLFRKKKIYAQTDPGVIRIMVTIYPKDQSPKIRSKLRHLT